MTDIQRNNPLHGVKLEDLLNDLVDHYGWDVLASSLNLNCFKVNPSIKSSLKFLRKTEWAREKVESFYLYKFKGLPSPNDQQYAISPRLRDIPLNHKVRDKPAVVEPTEEQIERGKSRTKPVKKGPVVDVWAKWRTAPEDDSAESE